MPNITNYSPLIQSMFGGKKNFMRNGINLAGRVSVFTIKQQFHTVTVESGWD